MQTEDTWDEGNKENCPQADEYDSDATIHSSDTVSESGTDVMETDMDEQQSILPVIPVYEELQSIPDYLSAVAELTSQHECLSTAAEKLPSWHGYSPSATAEHHLQYGLVRPPESSLHHRYSSPTVSKFPLQNICLAAATAELPPQQAYSPSVPSKLPPPHSLSTSSEFTPSHEYSPSAEFELTAQQGYSSLVAPEPPHLHGYSSSEKPVSQTQNDFSFLVSADLHSDQRPSSVAIDPSSQHGYSYSGSAAPFHSNYGYSSLPAKLFSNYEHSLPAEVSSQFEHLSPTELPSQEDHATPKLHLQHVRSLTATELPSQHGFSPPVSPTRAMDVKGELKEPTSQNAVVSLFLEDFSGNNSAAAKICHAPSNVTGLISFKKTGSGTPHTARYKSQAGSIAQYSVVDDVDCQPERHPTNVVYNKQMKTCNSDKELMIPPATRTHQEDDAHSVFNHEENIHLEDSKNLRSTTHHDISNSTCNILPTGLPSPVSENQNPPFSNYTNNVFVPRAFKVFDSFASRDQPKSITLHRHSAVLTPHTDVFKDESSLSGPQEITDIFPGTNPTDGIYHVVDNNSANLSPSKTMKHDLYRKTTHSQCSLDKSDAALHSSLPDISDMNAGLDLAYSEILHKNEDWLTLSSRRTVHRTSARRIRRYSSILLHASSLPNLDLVESVLQMSSETLDAKGDNLKTSIAEIQISPNPPIQEQSTLRQCRVIGDPIKTKEHSQTQKVPEVPNGNALNSYTTAISATMHYTPLSASGAGESLPDSAFCSMAKPAATTDLSDITPATVHQDTRALKAGTFVISDSVSGVFNGVHKPNFTRHQSLASCTSLDAITLAKTHEEKNENVPCSDWKQPKRQMQKMSLDVLPHNELKSAESKHFQSTLPSDPSRISSEPTIYASNNSLIPERDHCYTPPIETKNNFEVPTINNGTSDMDKSSLGRFTSQNDNLLSKSVSDDSVQSENTNVSVSATSNKPRVPGRRILGDHLQTYTTSRKTFLSSDHKSRSIVLRQDQPATTPKPSGFGKEKKNIEDTSDLTVPCDVNTKEVPDRTPKKDLLDAPDSIMNASSEPQPPPELPFHLRKVSFFPSSDGEEQQNSLQEYKTKSTLSFVPSKDKIEYHELVSVYYTLPRNYSRPLPSALSDALVSTGKTLLSPSSILNRKQEFHIDLANAAFPLPRSLGRRMSADSLLSNISSQHNISSINVTARHTPVRSSSWDESEHNMLSPKGIYSNENVSPNFSFNIGDSLSSDPVAPDVSVYDQYLNPAQATSGTADIIDEKKCLSVMPGRPEKREISHSSQLLNSFSPQPPEKGNAFQENFAGTVNPSSQRQNANPENRQAVPQRNEDCNQNILQVNLTCAIDNKSHNGKHYINTLHGLGHSRINTDASGIRDTCPLDHRGAPENRVDGGVESRKTQTAMHPGSENVLSEDLSHADLHVNSLKPQLNLENATMEHATPLDSRELQKTKQVQISHGNQSGTEFSSFLDYAKNLGDNDSLFSEDHLLDTTLEQPVTPPATNANRFGFDYTKDSSCDRAKHTNEIYSTINWEKMYKVRTRKHSYPDSFQSPNPTSVTLRRGKSDSSVQFNKQKTVSPSSSPLQALEESGTDNLFSSYSYDKDWTSLKKANKNNVQLDTSRVPLTPVANLTETMFKNTHRQKDSSYRTKRRENDPTRSVKYTKSSLLSKSFPDETARTMNTYRLSSTLESPEEFDDPNLTASHWPSNRSRNVQGHESPLLPSETDNYSSLKSTNLEESALTEQNIFEWEMKRWEEDQHVHRSKSLKNLNLQARPSAFTDISSRSNGRFSATTNVEEAYGRYPSSPSFSRAFKYNRKFWSHSELMSTDENDNWHSYSHNTPGYRSTKSYSTSPTVGFGIFGKEQQLAFLENIKRSLTEGRLWRPCYLKNPGFLRREADNPLETTLFPNSSFDGSTIKVPGLPPRETLNIYRDDPVLYSESDTDTTTDDEYYLDQFDKESEL